MKTIRFEGVDHHTVSISGVDKAWDERTDNVYPPGINLMSRLKPNLAIVDDLYLDSGESDRVWISNVIRVNITLMDNLQWRFGVEHYNTSLDGWNISVFHDDGKEILEVSVPEDSVTIRRPE